MFRKLRIPLLLLVVLLAPPYAFFAGFEAFSDHLEDDLHFTDGQANASKHAYAAASVHSVLRAATIGPETAETIVLKLGVLTEYMETLFKISEPDSTLEIMKDMYNNQVGIMASEWAHARQDVSTREVIIRLAQTDGLALSAYKVPMAPPERIEDYPQSVRHAREWFAAQHSAMRVHIAKALEN